MNFLSNFYNSLNTIELIILWVFVFAFIILIGISANLYLKNKELKILLRNRKDNIVEVDKKNAIDDIKESKTQEFVKDEIEITQDELKEAPYSKNVLKDTTLRYQTSPINIVKEKTENISFTEELTKKMQEELKPQTIELTDYEKEQEDKAIISYKELLSNNKDKLYNIEEDDDTTDFIKELKSFRSSL